VPIVLKYVRSQIFAFLNVVGSQLLSASLVQTLLKCFRNLVLAFKGQVLLNPVFKRSNGVTLLVELIEETLGCFKYEVEVLGALLCPYFAML